jgi:hypothetical protein
MKKITLLLSVIAIMGFLPKTIAQAKKHLLFEHFTNDDCSPCAAQNPVFDTAILVKNFSYVKHCEYHTNWPGTDPMNAYAAANVQSRVTYYNVTGVPTMKMSGNKYSGSPANVTPKMAQDAASIPSPLQVKVMETSNGTTRTAKVTVYTLSPLPAGTYKLRTAVCESEIDYTTEPGTNGETKFKDVFRKILPSATGDNFVPATTYGDSINFTYTYTLDLATWDTTKIYSIAWVQEETSKEVINCGSSLDPNLKWKAVCSDDPIKTSTSGSAVTFAPLIHNLSGSTLNLRVKFSKTQPANWAANLLANSSPVTDSVDLNINAGATVTINLSVTPGATPAIGEYNIIIIDLNDPTTLPLKFNYLVNSGITDLVINSDQAWGDGLTVYSTSTFQGSYTKGLDLAGETSYAVTKLNNFINLTKYNKVGNIKHLYFNVGWTFPSLTIENTTDLKTVLDNGGNMFISGQDIGWDTWDTANGGNGNGTTKNFYKNYMKATWVADGDATNNSLSVSDTSDAIFGNVNTSAVVNVYGSGTSGAYFYPDQISPYGGGKSVFQYSAAKIAGVRSTGGIFKTVYLGPGLEMIADTNVSKMIIKLSHDWFHGILSSVQYDQALQQLMLGQNFPNPANNSTSILLSNIKSNMTLQLIDITGRIAYTQTIPNGSSSVEINTSSLNEGIYLYRLLDGDKQIGSNRMQVIH